MRKVIEYYPLGKNAVTEIRTIEAGRIAVKTDLLVKYQEFEVLIEEEIPNNLIIEYRQAEYHCERFSQ